MGNFGKHLGYFLLQHLVTLDATPLTRFAFYFAIIYAVVERREAGHGDRSFSLHLRRATEGYLERRTNDHRRRPCQSRASKYCQVRLVLNDQCDQMVRFFFNIWPFATM